MVARDKTTIDVDALVERAQSGEALEVLAELERDLTAEIRPANPGLWFAKAVALHVLGDHAASAAAAAAGVVVAARAGREGWRAALLAMRALQLLDAHGHEAHGDGLIDLADTSSFFDEGAVVRDLAEAQVALSLGVADARERVVAYCSMAEAYARLRLYELAVPMYLGAYHEADADSLPPEAAGVQQLNLSTLHLTWASELVRVGLPVEAADHRNRAAVHGRAAELAAAGEHAAIWAERGRLFASCAEAQGPDPLCSVAAADSSLAALAPAGEAFERALAAPFLAVAQAEGGRLSAGLARIEAALACLVPTSDPLVVAATRHAHLVLLDRRGDDAAAAGLAYGQTLSAALWRQRARRLGAAEEVVRYERLRRDHEEVSRDSDVDALTGTATRRGFDRRVGQLATQAGEVVCVLVIDVDRLKQINDGHGHQMGDVALRGIGAALVGSTRGGDLVGRFGGDEFVALLSADAARGHLVADRMLAAVRDLNRLAELPVRVTVSIGGALTGPSRDLEATLAAADRSMYVAKRAGGDAVCLDAG